MEQVPAKHKNTRCPVQRHHTPAQGAAVPGTRACAVRLVGGRSAPPLREAVQGRHLRTNARARDSPAAQAQFGGLRGAARFAFAGLSLVCEVPLGPEAAERLGSWTPPPGLCITEVQGFSAGPGAPAPGAAPAAAPAPGAAPQVTLLVMRPCSAQDDGAAEGVLGPAPGAGGAAVAGGPLGYLCDTAGDAEDEAGEDEADLLDTSDPPGGGESAASLEDLEDEEAQSGGEGGGRATRRRGGGGAGVSKTCTYEGCSETTSQVAKQRKPWMCKKHRNKMYKDKYKKKKSDQALHCAGAAPAGSAGAAKLEESADNILSIVKRTGAFGDRPARPTLLEQVLNQKRLSLLRSPEVVQFLQRQQQLLSLQVLEQRQPQGPGAAV